MNFIWLFNDKSGGFVGGAFTDRSLAETWISDHKLSGVLTKYPINIGVFDWAEQNDLLSMKPETLVRKRVDPKFIGKFTTAVQEHYHFQDGRPIHE